MEGRPQGVPAVVSRGSRACGVTPRSPPRGSAPPHVGSQPPRDYHHCFVAGWVSGMWVGGGWRGTPGPTRSHTRSHTFTHVHTRSHTFTHVHTYVHTRSHVHARSHTFTQVHTRVHTRSRTFTHVHARSLTFTYVFLYDVITWGENKSSTQCYSYCRHSSLNSTVNNFIIGTTVINTHAVTTRRASHQSPGKVFAILS